MSTASAPLEGVASDGPDSSFGTNVSASRWCPRKSTTPQWVRGRTGPGSGYEKYCTAKITSQPELRELSFDEEPGGSRPPCLGKPRGPQERVQHRGAACRRCAHGVPRCYTLWSYTLHILTRFRNDNNINNMADPLDVSEAKCQPEHCTDTATHILLVQGRSPTPRSPKHQVRLLVARAGQPIEAPCNNTSGPGACWLVCPRLWGDIEAVQVTSGGGGGWGGAGRQTSTFLKSCCDKLLLPCTEYHGGPSDSVLRRGGGPVLRQGGGCV